jgi:hypothetical protein
MGDAVDGAPAAPLAVGGVEGSTALPAGSPVTIGVVDAPAGAGTSSTPGAGCSAASPEHAALAATAIIHAAVSFRDWNMAHHPSRNSGRRGIFRGHPKAA